MFREYDPHILPPEASFQSNGESRNFSCTASDAQEQGNNAYQPPDENEESIPLPAPLEEVDERPGERPVYVQQYDAKGHPSNEVTTELKNSLARAQNDILVTVGVCARTKDGGLPLPGDALRPSPQSVIRQENEDGRKLDSAYLLCTLACSPLLVGTRQRLQTFGFLRGIPISHLLRLEWRTWGAWAFLYPNLFMGNFLAFKRGDIFDLFRSGHPVDGLESTSRWPRASTIAVYTPVIKILQNLTFFTLMAPLEVYGILQALGIQRPVSLFTSPWTYYSVLCRLLGFPSFWDNDHVFHSIGVRLGNLAPLLSLLTYYYTWAHLQSFFARYTSAAIPKIAYPETNSFLDDSYLECLMYFNKAAPGKDAGKAMTVKQVLAMDLQCVGRLWQNFIDTVTCLPYHSHAWISGLHDDEKTVESSNLSQASESTVEDLPNDLREAMAALPSPTPEESTQDDVLGMRPEHQDLLDPMPGSDGAVASLSARRRVQASSPLAVEDTAQPPDIVASGREGDVEVLEIIEELSANEEEVPDAILTRTRSARLTNVHRRSSRSSSIPHSRSGPPSPAPPIGLSASRSPDGFSQLEVSINMGLDLDTINPGFHVPSTDPSVSDVSTEDSSEDEIIIGTQRLTLLSDFASRTMTGLLATQLSDLALLPLEAYILRTVALAFWPKPGLTVGGIIPTTRWTNDVFSPRSWFGIGLSAAGWRGALSYSGKILVLSGLQFAMSLIIWEAGYWWAWWRGRKIYKWGESRD